MITIRCDTVGALGHTWAKICATFGKLVWLNEITNEQTNERTNER